MMPQFLFDFRATQFRWVFGGFRSFFVNGLQKDKAD